MSQVLELVGCDTQYLHQLKPLGAELLGAEATPRSNEEMGTVRNAAKPSLAPMPAVGAGGKALTIGMSCCSPGEALLPLSICNGVPPAKRKPTHEI